VTLTSTTNKVSYAGNGATTSFAVTFAFWDADDLKVILRDADGVETTWTRGTEYSITGGSGSTGTLTVDTSPTDYTPASGETLVIKSNIGLTQSTNLPAGGDIPSDSLEQQLDKIVRISQQKDEELGRAPKFSETSTASDITFPDPSADKVIGWNAAGDDLENKTPNSSAYITFPGSSTDNAFVRFNGATGTSVQNSGATVDDNDLITAPGGLAFNKGGDIASASPLVIDTDGGYFDVTGTTNFAAMTVAAKRLFILQFDGALTITHGSGITLPGAANITTAAGDHAICYSTAADTVFVIAYIYASGMARLGANTFSGEQNFADNLLTRPKIKDYGESVNAIGSIGGGTQDIDLTLGNVVTGTVDTSATTFTFSNPSASGTACSFTLILTNGGSQTVNWPASVDWAGGTAPTLTAAGVDVLTFVTVDAGTIWYGFAAGLAMA